MVGTFLVGILAVGILVVLGKVISVQNEIKRVRSDLNELSNRIGTVHIDCMREDVILRKYGNLRSK